jgi:protein-S-isoprenylcysteine O-methyltransferase Ste14
MHRLELRVPPLLLAIVLGLAMWIVDLQWPAFTHGSTLRTVIAMLIALLGVAVVCSAVVGFRRARTTVDPTRPGAASAIVMRGIYRMTRNPMYLGFLLWLLGWNVFLGNVALAVFPVVFVLYMNRFQIAPEERALRARFGEPYEAYLRAVRRWI